MLQLRFVLRVTELKYDKRFYTAYQTTRVTLLVE